MGATKNGCLRAVTTEQKDLIEYRANGSAEPQPPLALPQRDVRAKKPPLVPFILKVETLRRTVRVASLLVLDFVGVVAALWTAMALKLAFHGHFDASAAWGDMK